MATTTIPAPRRRVTYVLPEPRLPDIPLLALPPHDAPRFNHPRPLIAPASPAIVAAERRRPGPPPANHPRHALGVTSLALDMSTQLSGRAGPEGLLYTGGKDGLVASWELNLPLRKRQSRYGSEQVRRGWDDDVVSFSDEDEDEDLDLLEDAMPEEWGGGRAGKLKEQQALRWEEAWEVNRDELADESPPRTSFRQCVQSHTDHCNDLLLAYQNQLLISASSDRTIKAWRPHDPSASVSPSVIGWHGDYVRALAHSREQGWVASAGLDRTVKIWDVAEGRCAPILDIPAITTKQSIYALACTPSGSTLVSGTPERVVRTWDPRSAQCTARLVGHTDNVRSVLVSEDGRYILSGSSDSTIRLWSLAAQRCLHTFTFHTDSVWSLFSQHPQLARFYSGDRGGIVCKVDLENVGDPSEGECVVLCRDEGSSSPGSSSTSLPPRKTDGSSGILRLVGADDAFIWTATASSSVKRWRDVPKRSERVGAGSPVASPPAKAEHPHFAHKDTSYMFPRPGTPPHGHTTTVAERAVALAEGGSLSRTTSRESHTVSFAPSPPPRSALRPQFYTPGSGGGGNTPISNVSSPTTSGPQSPTAAVTDGTHTHSPSQTLFAIPFESLVCLASDLDDPGPYEADRSFASAPTMHSLGSLISLNLSRTNTNTNTNANPTAGATSPFAAAAPRPSSTFRSPGRSGVHDELSLRFAPTAAEDVDSDARMEFEDREQAVEAVPLRSAPDEIIHGRHGLIRSMMLNDRRHVLTLNTLREVALWDIVGGTCVGRYSTDEVEALFRRFDDEPPTSSEILEAVKDRIDGQGTTAAWANLDCRTGSLAVHLDESRCFDGEMYEDELQLGEPEGEDRRLILGRLVLANLFRSFVTAEVARATLPAGTPTPSDGHSLASPDEDASASASIQRTTAPSFISFSDLQAPSMSRAPSIPSTPGITLALATPAAVPALPPPLSPIPQSPARRPAAGLPTSPCANVAGLPTPMASGAHVGVDYFSMTRAKSSTASNGHDSEDTQPPGVTPGAPLASPPQTPATPSSPAATKLGGLMGRMLGKGPKRTPSTADTPKVEAAGPQTTESAVSEEPRIDPRIAEQQRTLESIRKRHPTFNPTPPSEAPLLPLPASTALVIAEESQETGAWAAIYRGLVGTTGSDSDVDALEMAAPAWLLELLLADNLIKEPAVAKLTFLLEPWKDPNGRPGLPEMPAGGSRLNASRQLRVRKLLNYVQEKLAPPPPAGEQRPRADGVLELICAGVVLPTNMTLAAVRQYVWNAQAAGSGGSGEPVLMYRRKPRAA